MSAKKRTAAKPRTSLTLSAEVLKASAAKARKSGISRTMYLEQLVRKDCGLPMGVDLDEPETEPSVFG